MATDRIVAVVHALGITLGYPINISAVLRILGYRLSRGSRFYGSRVCLDTKIEDGARVASGVSIGPRVAIGRRSVVWQNTVLERNVELNDECSIGVGVHLEEVTVGRGSMVCSGVLCMGHGRGKITIGNESYIGPRCILDWSDDLSIGDFVHIAGPSTAFWTHSSVFQCLHGDALDDKSRRTTAPVKVGDSVYIGGNCTIYPGITISDHSIVLPNSAVNSDIPSWVMAGGVPVKVIRPVSPVDFLDLERRHVPNLPGKST